MTASDESTARTVSKRPAPGDCRAVGTRRHGGRRRVARLVRQTAAGLAVAAVVGLGGFTTTGAPADAATTSDTVAAARATAPRFVTGYSFHCSEEMAADNVTGPEVDFVVENYYLSARYDEEEQTWRYPGPTLIVVLNDNGFCVTVFRP